MAKKDTSKKETVVIDKAKWLRIQRSMKSMREMLKKIPPKECSNPVCTPTVNACKAELEKTIGEEGES